MTGVQTCALPIYAVGSKAAGLLEDGIYEIGRCFGIEALVMQAVKICDMAQREGDVGNGRLVGHGSLLPSLHPPLPGEGGLSQLRRTTLTECAAAGNAAAWI